MKQLHPKAFWLFFINGVISWTILIFMIWFWSGLAREDYYYLTTLKPFDFIWPILIAAAVAFIFSKLTYKYYRYEMSDIVFKKEYGIIWKKYVSIPYDRIQNVDINRGLLARILGLSDLQIQTAGGITQGPYGAFSEGRLMGVSKEEAERLRDELIQRARSSRSGQGL